MHTTVHFTRVSRSIHSIGGGEIRGGAPKTINYIFFCTLSNRKQNLYDYLITIYIHPYPCQCMLKTYRTSNILMIIAIILIRVAVLQLSTDLFAPSVLCREDIW